MQLLQARLVDERTKKFIKTGLIDECLQLTPKGQRILLTVLVTRKDIAQELEAWADETLAKKESEKSEA